MNIELLKEDYILTDDEPEGRLCPSEIKSLIELSLDADKAENIETIDLRDQTAIADYIVIASGTSTRQVTSIAEKMKERLESRGVRGVRMEGATQGDWVVLDAGDVIVHVFRPEVREFYNIEKMWRTHIPALMRAQATA